MAEGVFKNQISRDAAHAGGQGPGPRAGAGPPSPGASKTMAARSARTRSQAADGMRFFIMRQPQTTSKRAGRPPARPKTWQGQVGGVGSGDAHQVVRPDRRWRC